MDTRFLLIGDIDISNSVAIVNNLKTIIQVQQGEDANAIGETFGEGYIIYGSVPIEFKHKADKSTLEQSIDNHHDWLMEMDVEE